MIRAPLGGVQPPLLAEIFLLAVGSMFWPLLLVVDLVAFRTDRPVAVLASFWAGGMLTTVAVGCAIVFSLQATSLVSSSRRETDAAVDIAVGVLALAAAFVIRRGGRHASTDAKPAPGRVQRLLARGLALAFVAGILANVFPGVLPFVALKDIAELGYATGPTILVIVCFYLVMFVPVEAPMLSLLVAPRRTAAVVESLNAWTTRNGRTVAWSVLAIFGVLEIAHGVIHL